MSLEHRRLPQLAPAASASPDICGAPVVADPARCVVLRRRIRLLVAATITYNVIEAVIAISAGAIARR